MASILVLQTDVGGVPNANAYIDAAFFKSYHDARGNSYTNFTDTDIEAAIVRATDYIDNRFNWVGRKRVWDQTTQWPRTNAYDRDRYYQPGVPLAVKEASAEYALRALSAKLNPDPVRDSSGRVVQSSKKKVGPIDKEVTYVAGGAYQMPRYPEADERLSRTGLIVKGGTLLRS